MKRPTEREIRSDKESSRDMVVGTGPKHGGKTDKQLKELRRLMPWNWDARVEEHPPGEKAMQDFEDVVNYRIDGRKRRHLPVTTEVKERRKKKPAKAKVNKKASETETESNKENIPPAVDIAPQEEVKHETVVATPSVKTATPMAPPKEAVPVAESVPVAEAVPVSAPITPGFVLTPSTENIVSSQTTKKKTQGRPSRLSGCEKWAGGDSEVKKNQVRKVTFCETVDGNNASPSNTARVVNFSDTVYIDVKKYGQGIRVKRPEGCPPLFRTLEKHGRNVLPQNPQNLHAIFREPQGGHVQPRMNTPYKGRSKDAVSVISHVIQSGIKLREGAQRPPEIPPYKPLELSSKLAWAISQL